MPLKRCQEDGSSRGGVVMKLSYIVNFNFDKVYKCIGTLTDLVEKEFLDEDRAVEYLVGLVEYNYEVR